MKGERELILDIGSASVGAALAEFPQKGQPLLLSVVRTSVGTGGSGIGEMKKRVEEALKTSLAGIKAPHAPRHTRVVLASPWYEDVARSIVSKAEKPVKVSRATVARAVKSYHAEGTEFPPAGHERLESVVTQVYVNGYQTALHSPVSGTSLRIQLYQSAADKEFLASLGALIRTAFPGTKISFHSFPLIAFVVLRSLRDEEAFTFIDIGGEATDIFVVHGDGIRYLASFPRGTRYLAEEIGKGSDPAAAASRLSLFVRSELSPEEATAFAPLFEKAAASWNADLKKSLDAATSETPIPRATFIAADPEELTWFTKVLESGHEVFPTRIVPIVKNFFQSAIDVGENARYDSFLSLEALFFHTTDTELIEA